jgi:hypothetical protein
MIFSTERGQADLDRPTTAELHDRIVTDERLAPLATAITQSDSPEGAIEVPSEQRQALLEHVARWLDELPQNGLAGLRALRSILESPQES